MGKEKMAKKATSSSASASTTTAKKSTGRKKPGKGVLYEISLTAREKDGKVEFEPSNKFWNKNKNEFRFSKDDHPGMRRVDYHLVEFRLEDDKTGLNLRFPDEPREAMWVVNRPACPVVTDQREYDVVRPVAVVNDHTLLAINLNKEEGKFGFRLNFVGTGSPDYIPWDPIGDNNDGGLNR